MTAQIGYLALALALPVALYGALASIVGGRTEHWALVVSGRRAALAFVGLVTLAVVVMEYALLTHDFSVGYVARVGSLDTPPFITLISLWAALEGSILFWLWVLALYTGVCVWLYRGRHREELPYVTATLLLIGVFFLVVLLGPGNPFTLVDPAPLDGPGPNPLLQNHPLMALHPPTQYLGYVGFSVPYAFAIAALVTGKVDAWWVRAVRRWTLAAWVFLTLSIMAGGWWAYEVLGWGGYWAWDPVENAALMPWLVGTAFLHSVMVQERREMLRGWNVALIITTFALTIFGTFLTRSGVLGSVHAFSESPIGPLFLGFLAVVLIVSTALVLWRTAPLKSPGRLNALLSREAAFLVANLLFMVLTFTLFLGTVFPLVAEAATGAKVSVGAPYFNRMTVPVLAGIVFLMGVGPALPWRASGRGGLGSRFGKSVLAGVVATVLALILGGRGFWPLLTFGLTGFAAWTMLSEVGKGVLVRVRKGESPFVALARFIAGNRRRYGGYIVHSGVLLAAVAIAASWNHRSVEEASLRPGESLEVGRYSVRLDGVRGEQEQNRFAVIADVTVARDGKVLDRRAPRLNFYPSQKQPIPTPSVRTTAREDLFLSMTAFEDDGSSVTLKVIVMPLVVWLWVSGGVMTAGILVAVWPTGTRRVKSADRRIITPPTTEPAPDREEALV
ncbi:MAG: heme lyase CcmF/NrfE family subunit [Gemmatimonadota bacterium]|nr:MAG: heme lyase CcmF/NrfE family subunit [Gemmatimonadota bacterium]